jgi:hypothetical protein
MTDIEGEIQKRLQRRAETDKRHLAYNAGRAGPRSG